MSTTDTTRRRSSLLPARAAKRKKRRALAAQSRAAWLFLSPSLIVLGLFVVYPIGRTLYLSFTRYSLLKPPHWIGLQNYTQLAKDPAARNAIKNTLIYAGSATVVSVVLALLIALLLNQRFLFRGVARTAVFVPFIVSISVVSIAWSYLLDPDIGLLTYWGSKVGISAGSGFLVNPDLAMVSVIVVGIWKYLGFYVVMYLAALQSIPRDLYEAAEVDGAGPIRRFFKVTWPLLSNQTMLIAIIATITNVQAFDQIFVLTQGGPFFRTETLVVMIYRVGFQNLQFGYAAALSYVLVVMLMIVSLAQVLYFRRKAVHY
jgi:ABC-type sugar transport system permease subunit